uniref:Uncharacterized protein n=1 Tax=Arundo donax TaxID=35708 RepID=A0A0A9GUQ8_ARUDO
MHYPRPLPLLKKVKQNLLEE